MARSVLIVDDAEEMRFIARSYIEFSERWTVAGEAASGLEAIAIASEVLPDVILLDLEMPWLSGIECLPVLRELVPAARIALWTVDPNSPRAGDALRLGALAVLDKGAIPGSFLLSQLDGLMALVAPEQVQT